MTITIDGKEYVSAFYSGNRIEFLEERITALEGMVKELADDLVTDHEFRWKMPPEWMNIIAAAPTDDPVKLHETIKAALSFRQADKLEVGDASNADL